ncbi:MAG: DNA repair protein RecO [Firmicutes bacterium]|nr:DNA repair protein RecO [Bacillota bacterium]
MVDVRDRTYEAIVLRARDWREQDRLLTLVSLEKGPETVIARGAKKPGSKLAACAQPFCRATVTLSPAKGGVSFLKEGRQEESYLPPGGDVERFAYLSYFSELLLAGWPENRPEPGLFALARAAFLMIKLDDQLSRTARFFELRFLDQLGLLPDLSCCAACGQSPASSDPRRFLLSPQRGQLLCAACAEVSYETSGVSSGNSPRNGLPLLSPGALRYMTTLREAPFSKVSRLRLSPALDREIEQALDPYLSYHLDYAGKAKAVLKELL